MRYGRNVCLCCDPQNIGEEIHHPPVCCAVCAEELEQSLEKCKVNNYDVLVSEVIITTRVIHKGMC